MLKPHLIRLVLFMVLAGFSAAQSGVLTGMGDNRYGQLASTLGQLNLSPVKLGDGYTAINASLYSSLLHTSSGELQGMGSNGWRNLVSYGPSGIRPLADYQGSYLEPVQISPAVSAFSAQFSHTMIVDAAGNLWGWGYQGSGQLGLEASSWVDPEVHVDSGVVDVSAGQVHTVWLKDDGTVWGQGSNAQAQLGISSSGSLPPLPKTLITSDATSIKAGGGNTFVIKSDQTLWAVGANQWGQLGLGHQDPVNSLTKIADDVLQVESDSQHTLFIKTDGTLWGMGWNEEHQLGAAAAAIQTSPVQIASNVTNVSSGRTHSLFVDADLNLWGMGGNDYGQLGTGDSEPREEVTLLSTGFSDVSTSSSHTLLLKPDGSLWGAGDNSFGQLASAGDANQATGLRSLAKVKSIAVGRDQTYVIREDGSLWGAGWNYTNELGVGESGETYQDEMLPVMENVFQVDSGGYHALMLKSDGTVWAVGNNDNGQFGDGSTVTRSEPHQVAQGMLHVATGIRHSFFLDQSGRLWASGENNNGELGLGHTTNQTTRQWVADGIRDVAADYSHAAYVDENNVLRGMGSGGSGVLGPDAWWGANAFPLVISYDVAAVDCGRVNTYFLKTDGSLWGVGRGNNGELGENTTAAENPNPVFIDHDVVAMAAGGHHIVWLKSDGTLWGTGRNNSGQVGPRTTEPVTSPRLIASQVIACGAGSAHTVYAQVPEVFLTNLSTRVRLQDDGAGQLIAGFVISGTEPMEAVIRAVGTGLQPYGITNPLPDPSLKIFNAAQDLVASNNDWSSGTAEETTALTESFSALGAFGLSENSTDAAVRVTLNPGVYSAEVLRGDGPGGVVLLEVYNRNPTSWRSRLVNLSVRTDTGRGEDTLTAGFVIDGNRNQSVLARAIGPALADFGVPNYLVDPLLEVYRDEESLFSNDNWNGSTTVTEAGQEVGAFVLTDPESLDAAQVTSLPPGIYSAQVQIAEGEPGNAMVEIYQIDD